MTTATTATLTTVTRHNGSTLLAAWECWLGASSLACQVTGTAWNWYTQVFFSEAAIRRYQWAGQMIACLGMLAFLAGKLTRLHLDGFVESCQAQPEPATEPAPAPVEPERQPEFSSEPVTALGIRELRKLGTAQGIKGAARMRKEELLTRLAA